jgi:hypothetical protein
VHSPVGSVNGIVIMRSHTLLASIFMLVLTAGSALALTGKSVTEGGVKAFCKGRTTITGSIKGISISISTPLAAGGAVTAKGALDKSGSFKARGGRFTFVGTLSGKKVTGTWQGPSCYGSFFLQ